MSFLRLLLLLQLAASAIHAMELAETAHGGVGLRGRVLLSFKYTPHGSNLTFDCSPSGACVPCQYSEKTDEKYRCSETGYRIPLKCVEIRDGTKEENEKKSQTNRSTIEISGNNVNPQVMLHNTYSNNHRSLLNDSSISENGKQDYITYRSCIPPVNEEKLSVVGFEVIVLCLLLTSGSFVYFRKRQSATMSGVGAGRIQMNPRF